MPEDAPAEIVPKGAAPPLTKPSWRRNRDCPPHFGANGTKPSMQLDEGGREVVLYEFTLTWTMITFGPTFI